MRLIIKIMIESIFFSISISPCEISMRSNRVIWYTKLKTHYYSWTKLHTRFFLYSFDLIKIYCSIYQWCFTILLSYLRSSIAAADYVAEIEQLVKMVSLSKNLYIVYLYIIVKKEKKRKKKGRKCKKKKEVLSKKYRPASQAAAAHKYINIA